MYGHTTKASTLAHAQSGLNKVSARSSRPGQKSLRSRHDHYCQTGGQQRCSRVHSLQTNPCKSVCGWVQLPTNCNSSPFIIVSGSPTNTLYRRSCGSFSNLDMCMKGKHWAAQGCTGWFPPSLQKHNEIFSFLLKGSNCAGVILNVRLLFVSCKVNKIFSAA